MRHTLSGLTVVGFAALLLTACGGGGGGDGGSSGGNPNAAPIANAGPAQTVAAGVTVTLAGTGNDTDGTVTGYAWTQTSGTTVSLSATTVAQPTFVAPSLPAGTTLTFSLVVTDNRGATSAASTVNITVSPPPNTPPTANAGGAQSVLPGAVVRLDGTASSDPDGTIAAYSWLQTAGAAVSLMNANSAQATFSAPAVATVTTLTFTLTVTDNRGAASNSTATITVTPLTGGSVLLSGLVRYARPNFSSSFPFGLNYATAAFQPSRQTVVRVRDVNSQAVLATTSTNNTGEYALAVPGNTIISVEAVAQLLRQAPSAAPLWNVTVRDGVSAAPYVYADAAFNSGTGALRNVDIPLGINAQGQATGPRASGPFAILDSVYQSIQTVVGVAPQTSFPALIVDWGSQAEGTFFTSGPSQRIALLSDLTEDTDEFDPHVIAHEFGHYIEFNFSRADNIGGAHGLGDRLDARVAFGEGFGYAFAGIVHGDAIARDSFVRDVTPNDGMDNPVPVSGFFDIEQNPVTSPNTADDAGCWCSESSVWSILWDLVDSNADSNDSLAIGLQPIWDVLVGPQRTTPAFTTIFSFVRALKDARPAEASAINTLVNAQNITANTIEPFASTETHAPAGNLPTGAVGLPVYTTITRGGGPVVLQTGADAERNYNYIGSRRWLRYEHTGGSSFTITVASSGNDPDFRVYRNGVLERNASANPPGPEIATFTNAPAGTYLIDAYDCDNACLPNFQDPTRRGAITLTVTIN